MNKRYLTALRERPTAYDQETVFSTVQDALSRVTSQTPSNRNRRGRGTGNNSPNQSGLLSNRRPADAESIFSNKSAAYHAANPNPQPNSIKRFHKPNLAEFQAKLKGSQATGLPGIVSPTYPYDRFTKRVVFPTDTSTRRDI